MLIKELIVFNYYDLTIILKVYNKLLFNNINKLLKNNKLINNKSI